MYLYFVNYDVLIVLLGRVFFCEFTHIYSLHQLTKETKKKYRKQSNIVNF